MQRLKEVLYLNNGGNIDSIWENMSVNQRKNYIYSFLKNKGLGDIQSRAAVGNLQRENSNFTTKTQNTKSGAIGIAQWLGDRKKLLINSYSNPYDISSQLDHLYNEISGKSPNGWGNQMGGKNAFMQTSDLDTAVKIFRKAFERPGEHEANDAQRLEFALSVGDKSDSQYSNYKVNPQYITSEYDTGMGEYEPKDWNAENQAYMLYKMSGQLPQGFDYTKIPVDTQKHLYDLYKRDEEYQAKKEAEEQAKQTDAQIQQEFAQKQAEREQLLKLTPQVRTVSINDKKY